jgi:hypothetical protein
VEVGVVQTIMPGRTLVAIRTAEQIVARAVARMFMRMSFSNNGVVEVCADQTIAPGMTLAAMKTLEQTMARAAAISWFWAAVKMVMGTSFHVFLSVPTGLAGDARNIAQGVPV